MTYKNAVCRGCWAFGTACGSCERCKETRPASGPAPAAAAPLPTEQEPRPLRGTVATTIKDGRVWYNPRATLQFYLNWGDCPQHFSDDRAFELAHACSYAMDVMNLGNKLAYELDRTRQERDAAEQERDKLRARVMELDRDLRMSDAEFVQMEARADKLRDALERFRGIEGAYHPDMADDTTVRYDATCRDIRAMLAVLGVCPAVEADKE